MKFASIALISLQLLTICSSIAGLSNQEALNSKLKNRYHETKAMEYQFSAMSLPMSPFWGAEYALIPNLDTTQIQTLHDFHLFSEQLSNIPIHVTNIIRKFKTGIHKNITWPLVAFEKIPREIASLFDENLNSNPLFRPLLNISNYISLPDKELIRQETTDLLKTSVFPALHVLHDFLVYEYLPNARTSIAWSDLPSGSEWYLAIIRSQVSTTLTPTEIVKIGDSEIRRIQKEMEMIKSELGFRGNLQEFHEFLFNDPQFIYPTADALMTDLHAFRLELQYKLPRFFKPLPFLDMNILPIPTHLGGLGSIAYYSQGSINPTQNGSFFVNTTRLDEIPKWRAKSLFLHEGIPGHHLQETMNLTLADATSFDRTVIHTVAAHEGWALYAESIGAEMDFIKDPYSRFGQLSFELLRSARLVVDPGIHLFGWTRDFAIRFLKDNTFLKDETCIAEVDRYISTPAQALGYKIGELKIRELRTRAEKSLGDQFDVKEFHQFILENGSIPLDIVEELFEEWLPSQNGYSPISKITPYGAPTSLPS